MFLLSNVFERSFGDGISVNEPAARRQEMFANNTGKPQKNGTRCIT
jgi:hypothetical protein